MGMRDSFFSNTGLLLLALALILLPAYYARAELPNYVQRSLDKKVMVLSNGWTVTERAGGVRQEPRDRGERGTCRRYRLYRDPALECRRWW